MNVSTLFQIANSTAMIAWLLLLIFPNWKYTKNFIVMGLIALLSVFYTFIILKGMNHFSPDSFSTIENVQQLFQDKEALLAGWIHYLAFDLFVGLYIVENAPQFRIPRWLVSLILPVTFMFGPMGFLFFFLVKNITFKQK